jgi:hypothetical protein
MRDNSLWIRVVAKEVWKESNLKKRILSIWHTQDDKRFPYLQIPVVIQELKSLEAYIFNLSMQIGCVKEIFTI